MTAPTSVTAEQCVLGGLMIASSAWEAVQGFLVAEDFYRDDHRLIFAAIEKLKKEGRPADVVTLSEALRGSWRDENESPVTYLATLAKETPTAAHVREYAIIVREKSIQRELAEVGGEIIALATSPQGRDLGDLIDAAEQRLYAVRDRRGSGAIWTSYPDAIDRSLAAVEAAQTAHDAGQPLGAFTGFPSLDELTTGFHPGEMIIVAGRPNTGKSAFGLQIAENVGLTRGPVGVFSLEMPAEQLALRALSSRSRIDLRALRRGRPGTDGWGALARARLALARARVWIDDTPALTLSDMTARCRRLVRDHGELSLVVLDYLQLIRGSESGRKNENREQEVARISRGLKALAKTFRCPVLALAQLNRELAKRADKRPIMSDLRESGSLENDADAILFLYRDELYNQETQDRGIAEVIVGKQRNGPVGTVKLAFDGRFTRFDNLEAGRASDYLAARDGDW